MSEGSQLFYFNVLFRVMGITVSTCDSLYWKLLNFVIGASQFALCGGLFVPMLQKFRSTPFTSISMLTFVFASSASYASLSLAPYRGCNWLQLMQSMAAGEKNVFGRRQSEITINEDNDATLNRMSRFWVFLVVVVSALSYSLIFIAHGGKALEFYLHVDPNQGWVVIYVLFFYINLSWLTPMAVIRVSSFFLERRMLSLVHYLEASRASHVDIPHVMGWYEDLYESNLQLSRAVSPLVTQCIALYFSLIVLLLQANELHPPFPCHA